MLSGMVSKLAENPSVRLLKHVVRCYLRLSEHGGARDALKHTLPEALRNDTFNSVLSSEESVQRWLTLLLKTLSSSEGVSTVVGANSGSVGVGPRNSGAGETGTWQQYASLSENPTSNTQG